MTCPVLNSVDILDHKVAVNLQRVMSVMCHARDVQGQVIITWSPGSMHDHNPIL
jgi:hypothetical protein